MGFSYDQRDTLLAVKKRFIEETGAASLFDIGAGSLQAAEPLAASVERYVGVESDPARAAELRSAGLDMLEGEFPAAAPEGVFDLVLSSHSIPEGGTELYRLFLEKAWKRVAPGGTLLIITFKGARGVTAELAEELTGPVVVPDIRFNVMLDILSDFAPVRVEAIESRMSADAPADLVEQLSHGWVLKESERAEHGEAFERIVRERFFDGSQYIIPTRHLVLSVQKP